MAKKKNKKKLQIIVFVVVMLSLTAGLTWYMSKPKFVHYKDFGIDIPVNYSIHGIDVSRYQDAIDWADVKAMHINTISIRFSFIKATEGSDDVDKRFKRNWRAAKEAGISRGAYHFFNPYKDGSSQAQNFITKVKLQKYDLPPVLDIEQAGNVPKEILQQRVKVWLFIIEKYYKVKPIIYTGASFYQKYLGGKFDEYPLWVAHYLVKDKPRINRNWSFWQHNEAGRVNGIDAHVDFNVFNGDSADFKQILVK
ncbi:MAG: GH25 family lysozyme [Bacteroidota bacterium]